MLYDKSLPQWRNHHRTKTRNCWSTVPGPTHQWNRKLCIHEILTYQNYHKSVDMVNLPEINTAINQIQQLQPPWPTICWNFSCKTYSGHRRAIESSAKWLDFTFCGAVFFGWWVVVAGDVETNTLALIFQRFTKYQVDHLHGKREKPRRSGFKRANCLRCEGHRSRVSTSLQVRWDSQISIRLVLFGCWSRRVVTSWI